MVLRIIARCETRHYHEDLRVKKIKGKKVPWAQLFRFPNNDTFKHQIVAQLIFVKQTLKRFTVGTRSA